MSDTETPPVEQQTESRDFANLRQKNEANEARVKELETLLLKRTIKDAGFDPDTPIVGMIAEKFDGDIGDVKAFAEHATALGYSPASNENGDSKKAQDDLALLQNRGDQLRDAASPAEPPDDIMSQIAEAEQAGDSQRARRLKNQAVLTR